MKTASTSHRLASVSTQKSPRSYKPELHARSLNIPRLKTPFWRYRLRKLSISGREKLGTATRIISCTAVEKSTRAGVVYHEHCCFRNVAGNTRETLRKHGSGDWQERVTKGIEHGRGRKARRLQEQRAHSDEIRFSHALTLLHLLRAGQEPRLLEHALDLRGVLLVGQHPSLSEAGKERAVFLKSGTEVTEESTGGAYQLSTEVADSSRSRKVRHDT